MKSITLNYTEAQFKSIATETGWTENINLETYEEIDGETIATITPTPNPISAETHCIENLLKPIINKSIQGLLTTKYTREKEAYMATVAAQKEAERQVKIQEGLSVLMGGLVVAEEIS
jgi:hypothetical protein